MKAIMGCIAVLLLLLLLLLVSGSEAQKTCRAMAVSGGGAYGTYEAGLLYGLVRNSTLSSEETAWKVWTGISAGSVISFGASLFKVGDEQAMVDFMWQLVDNLNTSQIYKPWSDKGWEQALLQGVLLHSGLLNTAPLRQFLSGVYEEYGPVKDKLYVLGTTSLVTGSQVTFNETQPELLVDAVMASSAIPGAFETQTFNGDTFCDGGVIMGVNPIAAVERCLAAGFAEEDIILDGILTSTPHLKPEEEPQVKHWKTIRNALRAFEILLYNNGLVQLRATREAYPNVQYRYLMSPTTALPCNALDFSHDCVTKSFQIGVNDALAAVAAGPGSGWDNV